jgi:hypothetical protein
MANSTCTIELMEGRVFLSAAPMAPLATQAPPVVVSQYGGTFQATYVVKGSKGQWNDTVSGVVAVTVLRKNAKIFTSVEIKGTDAFTGVTSGAVSGSNAFDKVLKFGGRRMHPKFSAKLITFPSGNSLVVKLNVAPKGVNLGGKLRLSYGGHGGSGGKTISITLRPVTA